ncbi:MAG: DUF4282 domain-containing protein [Robiginitomaculum sp.]|nr:DUF4282 domain-containing protein [Robiginitomaculum sp.]
MKNECSQPGIFAAFFGFKRMVSPFFIGIAYVLGLFSIIVATIAILLKGPHLTLAKYGFDFESGLLVTACYICIVLGGLISLFIWRFICEMMIVLFGIHSLLEEVQQMVVDPIEAKLSTQRVQATIAPILTGTDKSAPTGIELATKDTFVPESANYEQQITENTPKIEPTETIPPTATKEEPPALETSALATKSPIDNSEEKGKGQ